MKLSTVTEPQWWERASEQQIAQAWETALQWRESDPQAAQAAVRIRAEVEHRFGIDLDTPAAVTPADKGAPGPSSSPRAAV